MTEAERKSTSHGQAEVLIWVFKLLYRPRVPKMERGSRCHVSVAAGDDDLRLRRRVRTIRAAGRPIHPILQIKANANAQRHPLDHGTLGRRFCAISIACNMCASATGTTIGWSAPTPRSRSPICSATPTSRCRHALSKSPHRNSRRPRNPPENAADVPGVVPRRREFR